MVVMTMMMMKMKMMMKIANILFKNIILLKYIIGLQNELLCKC